MDAEIFPMRARTSTYYAPGRSFPETDQQSLPMLRTLGTGC